MATSLILCGVMVKQFTFPSWFWNNTFQKINALVCKDKIENQLVLDLLKTLFFGKLYGIMEILKIKTCLGHLCFCHWNHPYLRLCCKVWPVHLLLDNKVILLILSSCLSTMNVVSLRIEDDSQFVTQVSIYLQNILYNDEYI